MSNDALMDDKKLFTFLPLDAELPTTVEGCHGVIRSLLATLSELVKRVEAVEIENTHLKEQIRINSSNSSLPPSKDYKKKKKKKPASSNASGGQVGHKGHFRQLVEPDKVDIFIQCPLTKPCVCGGSIKGIEDYQRHQVYELPPLKLQVTEYRLEEGGCGQCGRKHIAALPEGVSWGMTGPILTAFMSHLVSRYRLSRRDVHAFLAEQFAFTLSLGSIFNKQTLVNTALEAPVAELLTTIKQSPCINLDETGHTRDGRKEWLWGMMSSTAAFFMVCRSRGKKALMMLAGDYKGSVISDRYAVYNYFDSSKRQLCWAHLKRDFTRLSEKEDKVIARIGKNILVCERDLFTLWHAYKRGHLLRHDLQREVEPLRRRVGELLEQGSYTDPLLKAAGFCKHVLKHFNALWTFVSVEDVEPTNNHAERCLRHLVIWRKTYFGTRSESGSEFVSRSSSVVMTCKLQSKNAFTFLSQTATNYFLKIPAPSLTG